MTREDINNIIQTLCPNDDDFEKPIISPAYLKTELEALVLEQKPCGDAINRTEAIRVASGYCHFSNIPKELAKLPPVIAEPRWIPVSERLPELNKPLLVTAYHRVCYAHMISESGNYGYPVFRLHEIKDSDHGWVQETISHEPYSKGRIDAWMYIDIPEPYKVESEDQE